LAPLLAVYAPADPVSAWSTTSDRRYSDQLMAVMIGGGSGMGRELIAIIPIAFGRFRHRDLAGSGRAPFTLAAGRQ
jgi:hypothetical protein